ncbi:MAG: hypothetical protein U0838_09170 [Chloroflexota bacterium]
MEPLATGNSLDFSPLHVLAIMGIAAGVVAIAAILRKLVMAYGDEFKVLWLEYGPVALRKMLGRRSMPQTPWLCARCHSHNARGHSRCYSCGVARAQGELLLPNADTPTSPSAGRSQRTQR